MLVLVFWRVEIAKRIHTTGWLPKILDLVHIFSLKNFFFSSFFWKKLFSLNFLKNFVRSKIFSIFVKKIEKNAKNGPIHFILSNRVTFFWHFCTLRTHFEFFFYSGDQIRIFGSHSVVWMRFAILTQVSLGKPNAYYLQIWAPK